LDIREMNYFSGPEEYYDIVWDNGIREMKMAAQADKEMDFSEDWVPYNVESPDPSISKFWNPRYFRIKLLEDDTENTKECNHRWKKYVGFTESYEYCEICDARRK